MSIILPKTYVEKIESPLIFLAGPIKGAPEWRNEAIEIILSKEYQLTIASPDKRIGENNLKYILNGKEDHFERQRAWERHYLDIASRTGAILFWLPGEIKHNCGKVYGAMTRKELGDWSNAYKFDKSMGFCVGTDDKFPEINTLLYDLSLDTPEIEIKDTLEKTCLEAMILALRHKSL